MDERWKRKGGRRASGGFRIGVSAGVTAAAVLGAGLIGTRLLLWGRAVPPWIEVVLYVLVTGAAVLTVYAVLRQQGGLPTDGKPHSGALDADSGTAPTPGEWLDRFQVDERDGRRLVRAEDVRWIEAAGNYARLHTTDGEFLYRQALSRLEERLAPTQFVRVHRSALVNLEAVQRIIPLPSGDAELQLDSGRTIRLSRRYAQAFHERTGRAG